jgi:flagellar motor protein MotB
LIKNGVHENFLSVRGFGSQRPKVQNNSETNKAVNRRVEINISDLPNEAPSTDGYQERAENN